MAVYETDEIIEKVILVGVAFDTDDDTERSLEITFTLQHILAKVRLKN